MHKGVILLVKALCFDQARSKVDMFMSLHGGDETKHSVWDWYLIGGRWSGTLNPKNKEFNEIVKTILPFNDGFISTTDLEIAQPKLQEAWEKIGGTGKNPYGRDQYSREPMFDDILPLNKCGSVLEDWKQDPIKCVMNTMKRYFEVYWKESNRKIYSILHSFGFPLRMYLRDSFDLLFQRFSFYTNIYNTAMNNFTMPSDPTGWYAVMIDMHN